jgi:hypothetical protein
MQAWDRFLSWWQSKCRMIGGMWPSNRGHCIHAGSQHFTSPPEQQSTHSQLYFFTIHFNIVTPSMPRCTKIVAFLQIFLSKLCGNFQLLPCVRATGPGPSHPSRSDHPSDIWWRDKIMELFIITFSPDTFYNPLLNSNYSSEHLFSNTSQTSG